MAAIKALFMLAVVGPGTYGLYQYGAPKVGIDWVIYFFVGCCWLVTIIAVIETIAQLTVGQAYQDQKEDARKERLAADIAAGRRHLDLEL